MGHGTCVVCQQTFSFNPELVPSVIVNGVKEPICRPCVERTKPERVKNGVSPIEVKPGAYDVESTDALTQTDTPDYDWQDDLPEAPPMILTDDEVVAVLTKKPVPKPNEPKE